MHLRITTTNGTWNSRSLPDETIEAICSGFAKSTIESVYFQQRFTGDKVIIAAKYVVAIEVIDEN